MKGTPSKIGEGRKRKVGKLWEDGRQKKLLAECKSIQSILATAHNFCMVKFDFSSSLGAHSVYGIHRATQPPRQQPLKNSFFCYRVKSTDFRPPLFARPPEGRAPFKQFSWASTKAKANILLERRGEARLKSKFKESAIMMLIIEFEAARSYAHS